MFSTNILTSSKKTHSSKWVLIIATVLLSSNFSFAQVGISNVSITPHASSVLELRSTTSGFLPPRLTTAERDAVVTPATGLLIYNATTSQLNIYNGTSWQMIGGGSSITSLNGLSGATQTFVNGTNQTITSSGTTHTLGWTGQLSVANGGTGQSSFGGINRLLFTTTTDNLSSIATANDGVLITGATGIPSINTTLPLAVQNNISTLANSTVTNDKMANMAANTIKGNNTGSSAVALDLTPAQLTAMVNPFTSALKGLVPLSGGGTTNFLRADGTWASPPSAGGGTVTSVSVLPANGFSGTVATATTTPAITISSSVNGIIKGNGTALSAAASGTDYSAGTSALGTGILKSTTTTGALTIAAAGDFPTLNQNTTGTASTITGSITESQVTNLTTDLSGKQATLVSGTNIKTVNSTSLLGSGDISTSGELTGLTNAAVNSTYPDNSSYWGYVTTANGFPINGTLSGVKKGTINTQYLQAELTTTTYVRYWINASSSWSNWGAYLDSQDFTAKGDVIVGTGSGTRTTLTAGANNTILTADNTTATGLAWKKSRTIVELAVDVINNNATANTIADVTGLSFPVTAGVTYRFQALILYTTAPISNGVRWAINGPAAPTLLAYKSYYPNSPTVEVTHYLDAYDMPATTTSTTPSAAGNIATIEGIIKPSANGTVTIRFASEGANVAITAKAGSTLEWW